VLKLFDEVMYDNVCAIMQNTHELHELDLPSLNNQNRSALLVSVMESIGQEFLNFIILAEFKVLAQISHQKVLTRIDSIFYFFLHSK